MSRIIDPSDIRWERYPAIAGVNLSRKEALRSMQKKNEQ